MIHFLLLMLIPCIISIAALLFFKRDDSYGDLGIQLGLVALIMTFGLSIAYWSRTDDVEIWDGAVSSKARVEVSCEHSYECNCYYTTDSKGNSTRHCSTCYEHPYDVDWDVYSDIGKSISIARVDRQGLVMPQRWGAVYKGEPFAFQHHYTNYIKANPDSVLLGQKGDLKKFGKIIPAYPRIYDYYKVNHILNEGVPNIDEGTWNWLLSQADKTLGPSKQLNLIVVMVPTDDPSYVYAFKDVWVGGKKNDAIILIGSTDGHTIAWADVVSWTTNKGYIINLRDAIMHIGILDKRDEIMGVIVNESQTEFQRMHMKNYKWLTRNFQPSGTAMMILFILGTLLSLSTTILSITYHKGLWGDSGQEYGNRYDY
jgi:hypothetical protein